MKKLLVAAVAAFSLLTSSAQTTTYKITWGEEMKLKKGTADLDIIAADNMVANGLAIFFPAA